MKCVQMMGGSYTRVVPPEQPEGVERWGLNNLYLDPMKRSRFRGWTRWFDLHTNEHIAARKGGKLNCYRWLCEQTKPIVRWHLDAKMPASVEYPRAAQQGSRLFCSTLDWMIALAMYEQFTHIELFAWRMNHPAYTHQITSAVWWVRKAQEAGIEVSVWGPSVLSSMKTGRVVLAPQRQPVKEIVIPPGCLLYGLETTDRARLYHADMR